MSTEIYLENIENAMKQNETMCITCKKPTCGTCSAGISKITYKLERVLDPTCLKHLGLKNRKKGLRFSFQISVNVLHVDGTSVIYITVPRLFSPFRAICITIM